MRILSSLRASTRIITLLAACCVPAGCGAYTIKGVVVEGEMSYMQWSSAGEAPAARPVSGATIVIVRDPEQMRPTQVGRAVTGPDGTFTLVVDAFGAGWMEETWLLRASKSRVGSAELLDRLPGSPGNQMLVITLGGEGEAGVPWRGTFDRRESGATLMEEAERHW